MFIFLICFRWNNRTTRFSHHLWGVGDAYDKRKDFIYEINLMEC